VEGFLAGFSLAPKPLKGVEVVVFERNISTQRPIKDVLQALSTQAGLNSWLGESSEFFCHVGIKFTVKIAGEESKAVFTTVDIPRKIAFMVEALGEFEFNLSQTGDFVKLGLKVRRALAPGAETDWSESIQLQINALEKVLAHG
jgi:hypothetical protein